MPRMLKFLLVLVMLFGLTFISTEAVIRFVPGIGELQGTLEEIGNLTLLPSISGIVIILGLVLILITTVVISCLQLIGELLWRCFVILFVWSWRIITGVATLISLGDSIVSILSGDMTNFIVFILIFVVALAAFMVSWGVRMGGKRI